MDISITQRTRFFCLSILIALFVISTLSVSYVNSTSILGHDGHDENPTTKDWSIDTNTTVPNSITVGSIIKLEFTLTNPYSVVITRLDFRFFANNVDKTTPDLVKEIVENRVIPANSEETISVELRFSSVNAGNIDYPSADDNTSSSQIFLNTIRFLSPGHNATNPSMVQEVDEVVSGKTGNAPLNFYHEDADLDEDNVKNGVEARSGIDFTDSDTDDDGLSDGEEINEYDTSASRADTDDDGLTDWEEVRGMGINRAFDDSVLEGADPNEEDTDNDRLLDGEEILQHGTSLANNDTDGDGMLDGEEVKGFITSTGSNYTSEPLLNDTDKDGLTDSEARLYGTDPRDTDTDDDGLTDYEEVEGYTTDTGPIYTSDPLVVDTDGDTLKDLEEVTRGMDGYVTNPRDTDTDDDKLLDHEEGPLGTKTDPTKADTDSDGLDDLREGVLETNATDNDTDDDGLSDGDEVLNYTTNAKDNDSDRDGLSDGVEVNEYGTNPLKADTDGDGFSDYDEVTRYDTDPLNSNSFPTGLVSDTTGQNVNGDDGSGIAFWVYIVVLLVAVAVIGAIVALSMIRARTQ